MEAVGGGGGIQKTPPVLVMVFLMHREHINAVFTRPGWFSAAQQAVRATTGVCEVSEQPFADGSAEN